MKKLIAVLVSSVIGQVAYAQTFESTMNRYETPLGMNSVAEIGAPVAGSRDENFNRTVINQAGSTFTATAIGNLISVQTSGSNNTIVVNANQINKGNQTATTTWGSSSSSSSSSSSYSY